jgi:hypothetical protein
MVKLLASGQSNFVLPKDVYNVLTAEQRRKRDGESEVLQLLTILEEKPSWGVRWRVEAGTTSPAHILIFSEVGMQKFARYPEVLLADCTYKTNRFGMPLLIFSAVDNLGKTFTVAFALLSAETDSIFSWTLLALKLLLSSRNIAVSTIISDNDLAFKSAVAAIFPEVDHQLCLWHISNRISAKLRQILPANQHARIPEFTKALFYASSPEEYDRVWAETKDGLGLEAIRYLNMWHDLRKMWCCAWTQWYANLGIQSTQRSEGWHSVLKNQLSHSGKFGVE